MTNILNLTSNDLVILAWTQLVQVTLVLLVVGTLARALQHRRPRLSYALWMLVLLKCLTPPLWSSPTGVFSWVDTDLGDPEATLLALEAPTYIPAEIPSTPSQSKEQNDARRPAAEIAVARPGDLVKRPGIHWSLAIVVAWLSGSLLVFGLAFLQWRDCHRTIRTTRVDTPTNVKLALEAVRRELGMRRKVTLIVTKSGLGPLVVGFFRPCIILPIHLVEGRSPQRLKPIIAHELIHARRGDTVVGLCQFFSQLVWWFHPGVWWASRNTNQVCELCCDEEVVAASCCRPKEYAECLLDVLELRHRLRSVWALSGVRTAEITTKRMERIMKLTPGSRYWRVAIGVFALLFAAILLPGARMAGATQQDKQKLAKDADSLFASQQWDAAAQAYQKLIDKNHQNARSWFRMGYALHASGSIDAAIEAHKKAATFDRVKPIALYNLACACALKGKSDLALKTLELSVEAGFRSQRPLEEDTDFASLLKNARFKKLAKRARPLYMCEVYRQFDFWVGDWDVYGRNRQKVGTNKITKDERGFLIVEKWNNAEGSTGTSISFYDQKSKAWKQTWVDAGGNVVRYSGNVKGNEMRLKGESILASGKRELSRVTFTPLSDGRVRQFIERSADDGKTWKTYFDGHYVRRKKSNTTNKENKKSQTAKTTVF